MVEAQGPAPASEEGSRVCVHLHGVPIPLEAFGNWFAHPSPVQVGAAPQVALRLA